MSRLHDVPIADRVRAAGFTLIELPPMAEVATVADGDYEAWLGVKQQQDAEESLRALGSEGVDMLVVDHYGLDSTWETPLAGMCGSMLVIDDLADRPHVADVLLDQNPRPDGALAYNSLVPAWCRVLSGPSYALLRNEYVRARRSWHDRDGAARILVTLGGVDDHALIRVIIEGLSQLEGQLETVDLVVADPDSVLGVLGPLATRLPLRLHGPQPHLAGLMSEADLGIGAGGGTTWERLCVGLPSIVTSRANNQRRGLRELARHGAVSDLGDADALEPTTVRDVARGLLTSIEGRRSSHEIGQALVDGYGVQRVVESIVPTPSSALTLREAVEDDCARMWMWANDQTVRAQSLHPEAIGWASHKVWFQHVRDEPDHRLLILEAAGLAIGQLRFDLDGSRAIVNYSLDACVRGRGWGRQILELGIDWLRRNVAARPLDIVATVRVDNLPSAKVFERLGFEPRVTTQMGQDVFSFTRTLES